MASVNANESETVTDQCQELATAVKAANDDTRREFSRGALLDRTWFQGTIINWMICSRKSALYFVIIKNFDL